jgi:hypothetical protein
VLRATAGALAGLAAGSTFVLAHGGDPNRIHACVDAGFRLKITTDPSDQCPAPSVGAVDWNIRSADGEQGPDGPVGPSGPGGPAGPAGHDGADARMPARVVIEASPWTPSGTRSAEARCRAGEVAISGGWRVQDPSRVGEFRTLDNGPSADGRVWRVRVQGWYAYENWRLVVQAVCAPHRTAP